MGRNYGTQFESPFWRSIILRWLVDFWKIRASLFATIFSSSTHTFWHRNTKSFFSNHVENRINNKKIIKNKVCILWFLKVFARKFFFEPTNMYIVSYATEARKTSCVGIWLYQLYGVWRPLSLCPAKFVPRSQNFGFLQVIKIWNF